MISLCSVRQLRQLGLRDPTWVGIVVPHEAHVAVEAGDHEDVHRQSSVWGSSDGYENHRKTIGKPWENCGFMRFCG